MVINYDCIAFSCFWYFLVFYKAIYNFEYQNLQRLAFFLMVSLLLILHQVLKAIEWRLAWVCHCMMILGACWGSTVHSKAGMPWLVYQTFHHSSESPQKGVKLMIMPHTVLELLATTQHAARPLSLIFLNHSFFTVQWMSTGLTGLLLRTLWTSRLNYYKPSSWIQTKTANIHFMLKFKLLLL